MNIAENVFEPTPIKKFLSVYSWTLLCNCLIYPNICSFSSSCLSLVFPNQRCQHPSTLFSIQWIFLDCTLLYNWEPASHPRNTFQGQDVSWLGRVTGKWLPVSGIWYLSPQIFSGIYNLWGPRCSIGICSGAHVDPISLSPSWLGVPLVLLVLRVQVKKQGLWRTT